MYITTFVQDYKGLEEADETMLLVSLVNIPQCEGDFLGYIEAPGRDR